MEGLRDLGHHRPLGRVRLVGPGVHGRGRRLVRGGVVVKRPVKSPRRWLRAVGHTMDVLSAFAAGITLAALLAHGQIVWAVIGVLIAFVMAAARAAAEMARQLEHLVQVIRWWSGADDDGDGGDEDEDFEVPSAPQKKTPRPEVFS